MKQHAKGTLDEISDTGSFDSTHTEGSPEGTDNSPRTRQKKLCSSGSKIKHDAELQRRMNDVVEQLGIERIIFCQSIIRRFLEMGRFRRKVEMHRKRNKLVKKLVATEQEYVEHLSVVVEVYLQPLREGGSGNDFLPYPRALRSLSSDLDVLRNYNTHLLRTLEMRFQSWSPFQSIGDIFLTMNHFLKPYSNYCTHYKKALSTLGKLSRNSSFIKFIKKTAKRPECDSKLASHLLHLPYVLHLPYLLNIPVQRIPQYKSYLDAIVKNTWSDHPDLVSLQQAARTITDLSNFVSDTQADVQHIIKVLTVQISLRGDIDNLVTKTRRLVREGDLVEICTDGEREKRHLFLFNDLLLWVKVLPPIIHSKPPSPRRPPHVYQAEGMQPLLQITSVHELSSRPGFDAIAKGGGLLEHESDLDADVRVRSDPDESGYDGKGYGFSITTPTGVMVFLVSTRPLRKVWLADLYSCIDDAVARHYYRLVEKRKEAMHRELLSVTEGRVSLAEGRGRTPSISQSNPSKHKLSRRKKRPLTISRIMGRRDVIELGETLPETQTTHNPLLSRGSSATSGRTLSIGGELGQGQASGVPRGRGSIALDSSPLNIPAMSGNQKLLQKSVSATQLDILMAEMREDPRRAMFVAPRLDHSLKHIGQPRNKEREREKEKEKERDKEKGNKSRRTPKNHKLASGSAEEFELKPNMASKFTRSISWTLIPRLTVAETPKKANNNHIQQERPASKGGRFSLRAATVDHGFVGDSNEGETKGKDLPPLPPKLGRTGEGNMILSAGDKSKGKLRPAVGGARTKERKAGKEKERDEAKFKGT